MITIKDVARAAGVSIATVSRVVNEHRYVRAVVRDKVRAAIAELGYRPNGLASSFRTQQSRIVGVFLRQQKTPFSSALAYSVESALFERGYRVLLCSTNGDPDREDVYVDSMIEMRADGVIIRPTGSSGRTARNVERLREAGCAVVFADMKPSMPSISAVVCDNFSGGYEGMRHLVALGHRRIGVIVGGVPATGAPRRGDVGSERIRGILQAATDLAAGVELSFSEPFEEAGFDVGFSRLNGLLDTHPELTAIFATTDMLAAGAIQAAHQRGLSLPEQLSILGYDGVLESAITYPALSTVRQPIHEMGALAARVLLEHMANPGAPSQQVVLENSLIVRGSTAPARSAPLVV